MHYDPKSSFLIHVLSWGGESQLTVKVITLSLRLIKKESMRRSKILCP